MKAFRAVVGLFALTLTATLGAAAAQARDLSESVSGDFVDTAIDTNGDGVAAAHFVGKARGSGGPSYQGLTEIQFTPTGLCAPGEVEGIIAAYSIVRRYSNGDLLFSKLVDGSFCLDPTVGKANVTVNAEITGGTGHLEGATGSYTIQYEVTALLPDPTGGIGHGAFAGTATGTINEAAQ
jgi:hypothetical protein